MEMCGAIEDPHKLCPLGCAAGSRIAGRWEPKGGWFANDCMDMGLDSAKQAGEPQRAATGPLLCTTWPSAPTGALS